jgi:hypothetical protein
VAYTGLFLTLSGAMVLFVAPKAGEAGERPPLADYYTEGEAERLADGYNAALRERLGVDEILDSQRREPAGAGP